MRSYRKLCAFYKIFNNMSPKYLSDIIPSTTGRYASRNANNISLVSVNNNYNTFKSRLLQLVKTLENSVCTSHNPIEIKYLTRLRLVFSYLRYH